MNWREELRNAAQTTAERVDEIADRLWQRFTSHMAFDQPRQIMAYRGYGNGERLWVRGRLLANKPISGPKEDDGWWDNLVASYQRWESDEVPGADIELTCGDIKTTVATDDEGYYKAEFELRPGESPPDRVSASYVAEGSQLSANHEILCADERADFMLISDVDDTVIHTGITDLLVAARLTFLKNARTRKPLDGVASLYRALARGSASDPVNPVFYLSNSGWNMYDLLRDFMDLNDVPFGPLLLRDLGILTDSSDHKTRTLRALFDRFPGLPVILVGDSGQSDAKYYADIASERPNRVKAIYIRDIDPSSASSFDDKVDTIIQRTEALNVPFLRVRNSAEIARHAVELGVLPADRLPEIDDEVARDKARETSGDRNA